MPSSKVVLFQLLLVCSLGFIWCGFPCLRHPCLNGICIDELNSTRDHRNCFCSDGFTGYSCQINWDECKPFNPCQNGGTCNDGIASFNCSCPENFAGALCEYDLSDCSAFLPCENNGTCQFDPGLIIPGKNGSGFYCACPLGFKGDLCQEDISVCNSTQNVCLNGGSCIDGFGHKFSCQCNPGFVGEFCETNWDECSSTPCQNGGVCVDGVNDFDCACQFSWHGKQCELKMEFCSVNPCQNGGLCLIEGGTPTCYCVPDFHGKLCEDQYNECEPEPKCFNGGTCIDGVGGFNCSCPPDVWGPQCQCTWDNATDPVCQDRSTILPGTNESITPTPPPFWTSTVTTKVYPTPTPTPADQTQGFSPTVSDELESPEPTATATSEDMVTPTATSDQLDLTPTATLDSSSLVADFSTTAIMPSETISEEPMSPTVFPSPSVTVSDDVTEVETSTAMEPTTTISDSWSTEEWTVTPTPSTASWDEIYPTPTPTLSDDFMSSSEGDMVTTFSTATFSDFETVTTFSPTPSLSVGPPDPSPTVTGPWDEVTPPLDTETTTEGMTGPTGDTVTQEGEVTPTVPLTLEDNVTTPDSDHEVTPGESLPTSPATISTTPEREGRSDGQTGSDSVEPPTTAGTEGPITQESRTGGSPATDVSEGPTTTSDGMSSPPTRSDGGDGGWGSTTPQMSSPTEPTDGDVTATAVTSDDLGSSAHPVTIVTGEPTTSPESELPTSTVAVISTVPPTNDSWDDPCFNYCQNAGKCIPRPLRPICICPFKFEGDRCEIVSENVIVPALRGNSFLRYKVRPKSPTTLVEISLQMATVVPDGLVLYTSPARPAPKNVTAGQGMDEEQSGSYALIFIQSGHLVLHFSCGSQSMEFVETRTRVNNGFNFTLDLTLGLTSQSHENRSDDVYCLGKLSVNGSNFVMSGEQLVGNGSLTTFETVLVGGVGETTLRSKVDEAIAFVPGFRGCLSRVSINKEEMDMYEEAVDGQEVSECETFACVTNPCSGPSKCIPSLRPPFWECICTLGYAGQRCQIKLCLSNPCKNGAICSHGRFLGNGSRSTTAGLLSVNNVTVTCLCPLGFTGPVCESRINITKPSFHPTEDYGAYISYYGLPYLYDWFQMKFHFVTTNFTQIALLVYMGNGKAGQGSPDQLDSNNNNQLESPVPSASSELSSSKNLDPFTSSPIPDFFSLSFLQGYLGLTWNLGSGTQRIVTPSRVDPRLQIHTITFGRAGRQAWLKVDGMRNITGKTPGPMYRLNVDEELYIGGHKTFRFEGLPHDLPLHTGFQGCIFDLGLRAKNRLLLPKPFKGRNVKNCFVEDC